MNELSQIYARFLNEKHKIPPDMSAKLQTMHDYIEDPLCIAKLSQEEQEGVKDIMDLEPKVVQVLFISIVKSILSPKMYCSFEKNCKIKMEGYMSRWTNAYITFQNGDSVTFSTFKKKLQFTLLHLEVNLLSSSALNASTQLQIENSMVGQNPSENNRHSSSSKKQRKKPKSVKVEFKYKGMSRLKIKFEHREAADSFISCINQMQASIRPKEVEETEQLRMSRKISQSLMQEYKEQYRSEDVTFKVHKTEPKVHIEIFMRGHFWDALNLVEFILSQKLWNSKIKEETIIFHDIGAYFVERRFRGSNMLANDRRTLSKINLQRISENQYLLEEEVAKTQSDLKGIIISEMHMTVMIELMAPKVAKLIFEATFNGKGYFRKSDSRSMLIQYFNDVVFLNKKYNKLKQKNKLNFQMELHRILKDKFIETKWSRLQKEQQIEGPSEKDKEDEGVYKVMNVDRGNSQLASIQSIKNQHFENEEEFFDMPGGEDWDDEEEEDNDDESNSTSKENSNLEADRNFMKSKPEKKQYVREQQEEKREEPDNARNRRHSLKLSTVENSSELMRAYKPKDSDETVKIEFLKLIREKVYEKCYLKDKFDSSVRLQFKEDTPWYDPSLLLPAGNEYEISESNELIFVNQELIQGQKDSLKFIVKQIGANIISGKSILNVSLPVDIFEPRSLLERSASSFGYAPKFLKPVADADVLTQIKAVTGFVLSVSPLQLIMQKPFNPILGETFQAYLGGIPIYYEQVSHHPPISSYYMKCEEFTMHGYLNAVVNVSLNSGSGGNSGIMNIEMKNGNKFHLSFFPADISGLIYGKRKYAATHKAFVFNRENRLFVELSINKQSKGLYERAKDEKPTKGDLLGGIFRVSQKFMENLEKEKSLLHYPGLKKSDMEEKLSDIKGVWFDKIYIDGELVSQKLTAYSLQYFNPCLPSDSNFRLDVMMHRVGDLARSQTEKEILENVQRQDRKLREKYGPKK